MTLPDSLLGRTQWCPQQCTASCTNMPVDICLSVQALMPCFVQSSLSLEHVQMLQPAFSGCQAQQNSGWTNKDLFTALILTAGTGSTDAGPKSTCSAG